MTGEVIKSFMVGLGFGVDEGDLAKFNKALTSATLKVTALSTATIAAAAAVVKSITSISGDFEQLGYEYRLIAPSINKVLLLRQEMLHAYSAAGVNIYKVIQASVKLNFSIDKTKMAFKALYTGVASRFFPLIQKQSDMFRNTLYKNMPKIQHGLEAFIKFIFKSLEIVTQLGGHIWSILTRVYEFFAKLHQATDGWSTVILGVIAAWKLLNLEFLATPLGMIIAGLVGILALFDDFKTWQEGGKSLFNWSSFVPVIKAVGDAIDQAKANLESFFDVIGNIGLAIYQVFHGRFTDAFNSLSDALKSFVSLLSGAFKQMDNLVHVGGSLGTWASNLFGNSNAASNIQNNPAVQPMTAPLGTSGNNSQTNQHVTQQTTINVNGAANANATGHAVAGQQGQVNRNMIDGLGKTIQ